MSCKTEDITSFKAYLKSQEALENIIRIHSYAIGLEHAWGRNFDTRGSFIPGSTVFGWFLVTLTAMTPFLQLPGIMRLYASDSTREKLGHSSLALFSPCNENLNPIAGLMIPDTDSGIACAGPTAVCLPLSPAMGHCLTAGTRFPAAGFSEALFPPWVMPLTDRSR